MCYNYIYKKQGVKKPISEMGRGGLRSYKKIKRDRIFQLAEKNANLIEQVLAAFPEDIENNKDVPKFVLKNYKRDRLERIEDIKKTLRNISCFLEVERAEKIIADLNKFKRQIKDLGVS